MRINKLLLAVGLFLLTTCYAQEEVTITTYYPSPEGSYNELTSNSMKIGTTYSASSVPFVNNGLIVEGNVGIGTTTPSDTLHVYGISAATRIVVQNPGMGNFTELSVRNDTGTGNPFVFTKFGSAYGGTDAGLSCNNLNMIAGYGGPLLLNHYTAGQPIVFGINNTERMRIGGTGNVGIGTTNPENLLHIVGDNGQGVNYPGQLQIVDSNAQAAGVGGKILFGYKYTDAGAYTYGPYIGAAKSNATAGNSAADLVFASRPSGVAPVEIMRITSGGNVGIGTTAPSGLLTVQSLTTGVTLNIFGNGGFQDLAHLDFDGRNSSLNRRTYASVRARGGSWIPGAETGNLGFWTINNGTLAERMRIIENGNVGIGTATPNSRLDLGGGCMTGSICSDLRLKKNIEPLSSEESYLSKVAQLRGVRFQWKDRQDNKRYLGLIAQEVEQIIPEIVTTSDSKDNQKGVYSVGMEAVLVEAIKELKADNDALRKEVETLKARLK